MHEIEKGKKKKRGTGNKKASAPELSLFLQRSDPYLLVRQRF
jgi:hypothetical protein